ncbi:ankyrin repeat-containing protein [Acanthamoeba castellanii str. Neff]|uniref:Ankyrin repeat-containing protein n=1 Tax=Acanthamoeba castellanii (strain ATCC 30010 / Neff) TaxID=1257118 RepID=L8GN28_ACACF|nr:ankyrin repeat-containing protein [Acanthamoeba castellanii str. Neff]ELR14234.1 ankyrin repeat-containing protein [Acanthamoeba castellanii str. Neff]
MSTIFFTHTHTLWQAFEFGGMTYQVGDCVALQPEEDSAVWYTVITELFQAGQADDPHEKELCCSDHVDPNPVNCISHKILVVSKDEFLVIEKTIQRELEAQFPGLKSVALHKKPTMTVEEALMQGNKEEQEEDEHVSLMTENNPDPLSQQLPQQSLAPVVELAEGVTSSFEISRDLVHVNAQTDGVSVRAKVMAVAANVAEQAQGMKKRSEELGRSTLEQISVSRDLVASGDDVVLCMPAASQEFDESQQLIKATKKGDVAEVEFLLLMMGANVNVTTSAGKSPLMLAASRNDVAVLRVLLDRSPELDACCNLGRTVVHYAASHGSREALKLLLDYGAPHEEKDLRNCTPSELTRCCKHAQCATILKAHRAKPY